MKLIYSVAIVVVLPAAAQAQDAKAFAAQIARATVQPEKAVTDAASQFEKEFDGGVVRGVAGRTVTPAMRAYLERVKAAGRAEMIRQLRDDAVPKMLAYVESQYLTNFSANELRKISEFWTSPAGLAWTAEMQRVVLQGGGAVTPPPEHAPAIIRYMSADIGRRESAASAASRAALAQQMSDFLTRVRPRLDAAMAAVGRPTG